MGTAVAGTTLCSQTAAAGSTVAANALWVAVVKWGAVAAVAGPLLAVGVHVALRRAAPAPRATASPRSAIAPEVVSANAAANGLATSDSLRRPGAADPDERKVVVFRNPTHVADRAVGRGIGVPPPSALQAETRLLAAARADLAAGDPQGALDDVTRLAARFPEGKLRQEREVLAIDCLAALGNRQAMRSRALAFLEHFPDGPYAAHVRQLVEVGQATRKWD